MLFVIMRRGWIKRLQVLSVPSDGGQRFVSLANAVIIKDLDKVFAGDGDGDGPTVALKVYGQRYTPHDSEELVGSERLGGYQTAWDIKSNHDEVSQQRRKTCNLGKDLGAKMQSISEGPHLHAALAIATCIPDVRLETGLYHPQE